jgi:hypothetical protein
VLNIERPPLALPEEKVKEYGYNIYSARYGNIYTVRQLLQLAKDAQTGNVDPIDVWTKNNRYFDALRPSVEPDGYESIDEALACRRHHLDRVRVLFRKMDILVFTLGLTEGWVNRSTGKVYPTAPGTIAGEFDETTFEFRNFTFGEIYGDLTEFYNIVTKQNQHLRIILTVSPVPLTATATGNHVLVATTYSKAVLRAVAGQFASEHTNVDYFPSYEIIASPWSRGFFYESNLRSVNSAGVANVMRTFFEQHATGSPAVDQERGRAVSEKEGRRKKKAERQRSKAQDEVVCEDLLLEAFAP